MKKILFIIFAIISCTKIYAQEKQFILVETKVVKVNQANLSFEVGWQPSIKIKDDYYKDSKIIIGKSSLYTKAKIESDKKIKIWFKTVINNKLWDNFVFEKEAEFIDGVPEVFIEKKEREDGTYDFYLIIVKGTIDRKH